MHGIMRISGCMDGGEHREHIFVVICDEKGRKLRTLTVLSHGEEQTIRIMEWIIAGLASCIVVHVL